MPTQNTYKGLIDWIGIDGIGWLNSLRGRFSPVGVLYKDSLEFSILTIHKKWDPRIKGDHRESCITALHDSCMRKLSIIEIGVIGGSVNHFLLSVVYGVDLCFGLEPHYQKPF